MVRSSWRVSPHHMPPHQRKEVRSKNLVLRLRRSGLTPGQGRKEVRKIRRLDLPTGRNRPMVQVSKRGCQKHGDSLSEASLRVLPGSQRLSSSKGQNRRKPATQSYGPSVTGPALARIFLGECLRLMVARLPKGWAGEEPVRPRVCKHLSPIQGSQTRGYTEACLAFFPPTSRPRAVLIRTHTT
jgi:hypothetical protein